MTALQSLLDHPLFERLGWTLMHSIWQCVLIALGLAVAMAATRRAPARYLAGCAALLACLAALIITFVMLGAQSPSPVSPLSVSRTQVIVITDDLTTPAAQLDLLSLALPAAAIVWLVGVTLLCVRHIGGWISLQKIRRGALAVDDHPCCMTLFRLMERIPVSWSVRVASSVRVGAPAVVGFFKPVILVPCTALTGLSPIQLESLLAHELAHIRRHDYLVNLVQTAIETLLFYHPAVWWIGRQVRQERENCCDDVAVSVIGNRQAYGAALAAMEQLRGAPDFALAVSGGSLLRRIRRLAMPEPRRVSGALMGMVIIAGVLGLVACNQMMQPRASADEQPVAATEPITAAEAAVVDEAGKAATDAVTPRAASGAPDPFAKTLWQVQGEWQRAKAAQLAAEADKVAAQLTDLQRVYSKDHPQVLQNEAKLKAAQNQYRKYLDFYQASVPNEYYLSGVQKGGMHPLKPKETLKLKSVLLDAGVPENQEGKWVIIVHKVPVDGSTVEQFPIRQVMTEQDGPSVQGGDVIMLTDRALPEADLDGPRYFISGEIANPGTYPLKGQVSLLQALVAGGMNPPDAMEATVTLARDDSRVKSYRVAELIGKAGNLDLRPGDKINVSTTKASQPPPMPTLPPATPR